MQLWHNLYDSLEKYIIVVKSEEISKQSIRKSNIHFSIANPYSEHVLKRFTVSFQSAVDVRLSPGLQHQLLH